MLCCVVLCCVVLGCVVLCCVVLGCDVMCCVVLCCVELCWDVLGCVVLGCVVCLLCADAISQPQFRFSGRHTKTQKHNHITSLAPSHHPTPHQDRTVMAAVDAWPLVRSASTPPSTSPAAVRSFAQQRAVSSCLQSIGNWQKKKINKNHTKQNEMVGVVW